MGVFNFQDISWKYYIAVISKSGKLLKFIKDNLLSQIFSKTTRKYAHHNLLFVKREGFLGDVLGLPVFKGVSSSSKFCIVCELAKLVGKKKKKEKKEKKEKKKKEERKKEKRRMKKEEERRRRKNKKKEERRKKKEKK
ncbi:hypothetical protein DUI87_05083 [Hirundo rustica rustica]|uniref:Uncharacterized protein n=1 Tax=Hirundo rustica rustica TaxID=333673 RepID=A0A3M0KY29_HIRRU|nr:hypothetical protein DUI87_05083 [Hirundo rustica rustica]